MNLNLRINVGNTLQSQETQQALNKLCDEYKDIFSLYQGDIYNTKLLTMDIGAENYPSIAQKPYMFSLKHSQWVCEELEMLEKGWDCFKECPLLSLA